MYCCFDIEDIWRSLAQINRSTYIFDWDDKYSMEFKCNRLIFKRGLEFMKVSFLGNQSHWNTNERE